MRRWQLMPGRAVSHWHGSARCVTAGRVVGDGRVCVAGVLVVAFGVAFGVAPRVVLVGGAVDLAPHHSYLNFKVTSSAGHDHVPSCRAAHTRVSVRHEDAAGRSETNARKQGRRGDAYVVCGLGTPCHPICGGGFAVPSRAQARRAAGALLVRDGRELQRRGAKFRRDAVEHFALVAVVTHLIPDHDTLPRVLYTQHVICYQARAYHSSRRGMWWVHTKLLYPANRMLTCTRSASNLAQAARAWDPWRRHVLQLWNN